MKEVFANADIGIGGLVFFFLFFLGILLWLYQPNAKEKFQKHAEIPLKDD